jgi:NAD(P)-dependent dehydrogenase (short-subunit alcohol dehydrogenase family)
LLLYGIEGLQKTVVMRCFGAVPSALQPLKESLMKMLLVGASGTIGRAVQALLAPRHDIITVGRSSGDLHADFTRPESLTAMFQAAGKVDAIISVAGNMHFGPLTEMTAEQFNIGLQDKLLGQVRLVLEGQHWLNDGGSITLTSGCVAIEPIRDGANATTVNAALEGFVTAAAVELQRGQRINVVSPTLLTESAQAYGSIFPGFETVPAQRVALAYQRSVEGVQTGRVFRVNG